MKKQITIDELMPFLKKGWVAMDEDGTWVWYEKKPTVHESIPIWRMSSPVWDFIEMNSCFYPLAAFKGNWKDSLRKVE